MVRNGIEVEQYIRDRICFLKSIPNGGYEWMQNKTDAALKELYALLIWMYEEEK